MPSDLLDLDVQLLLLRHGRARVLSSLARVAEISEKEIERKLAEVSKKGTRVATKPKPNTQDILDKAEFKSPLAREYAIRVIKDYENKRFLPGLKAVEKFCGQHGVEIGRKSRSEALPMIVSILTSLSEEELRKLIASHSGAGGYADLADAIIHG